MPAKFALALACSISLLASPLVAQVAESERATPPATPCTACAEWNVPQRPFRIFGNAYFVGTHGLSAILLTSSTGHVLIDGALPESAPQIIANIRQLGFLVEDVRVILNSHAHYDHAGGIASLARASGASVMASPWSARVLERGTSGPDDPQYGILLPFAPVAGVRVIADGETVRVGALALTAHFTPGHTPGGTSWSWQSCEQTRCLDLVYADSQTPVSADSFQFTRNTTYPSVLDDFARGSAVLERLSCDVLVTPHPVVSRLWERLAARDAGTVAALIDRDACKRYAAESRERLAARVAAERTAK